MNGWRYNAGLSRAVISMILLGGFSSGALAQWTQVLSGNGNTLSPQVWTIASTGTGKILAGTLKGIFASTNNGTSWVASNNGLSDGFVNSFTVSGTDIFVAMNSSGGLFYSSNDGATWAKVNNGLPSPAAIALAASNGRVFALINNGSVYFTDNKGGSWTLMTNGPSNATSLSGSGNSIFLGSPTGVYRSTNAGASWTAINSGLTSTSVTSLSSTGSTVIVWVSTGLFLSTDNGTTWSPAGLPQGYPSIAQNGTTLMVSFVQGQVWKSSNNGVSWSVSSGVPTSASYLISTGSYFFAATEQGIYISADNGVTWSSANVGVINARPTLSADGPMVITTNGQSVLVSSNSGTSWSSHTVGTTPDISVLAKGNSFFVADRVRNYSSINNGTTWNTIPGLAGDMTLAAGEGNLFAADQYNLSRSVNGGNSWTTTTSNQRWISTIAAKDNKVFAGSLFSGDSFTGVFSSLDAGLTWHQVNNSLYQINSLAYNGSFLVCGTGSGIYKSVDGGASWTLAGLAGSNITSVIFSNGFVLAAHKGVDISYDNGVTWTPMDNGIKASLDAYHEVTALANSGTKLLATTTNGSVWVSCANPPKPVVTSDWTHYPTDLTSSSATNNQWYLDGTAIVGETSQNLHAVASGAYSVKVTINECASEMSSSYILTDCILPPTPTITVTTPNFPFSITLTSSASTGNQWYFNGNSISGATNQDFVATASGNYTVATSVDRCVSNMSLGQALVVTGDLLLPNGHTIDLFPNPVSTKMTVSLENLNGSVEIRVMDLMGQVLHEEVSFGGRSLTIETSSMSSGMYIIEAKQSSIVFRSRFVRR